MSLAVNNATSEKEFTQRYTALLEYYGMEMEKIQPDEPNENGGCRAVASAVQGGGRSGSLVAWPPGLREP